MTAGLISGTPLVYGRCNPYGAETGGPARLMGGLHGPASARTDPVDLPGLPAAVQEGEWSCPWPAVVRVRMECRHGHRGQVMQLCAEHDETVTSGEIVAGQVRQVKTVKRVKGHFEMISARQAGVCPPCAYPGKYAELYKEKLRHEEELALLNQAGQWYGSRARAKRQRLMDIVALFDEGQERNGGPIHLCPLTLVAVS